MNNQKILNNAPEGATHFDAEGDYLRAIEGGYEYFYEGVWRPLVNATSTRSLSDIRRIAELEGEQSWQPRKNIVNYEEGQSCWLLVNGKVRFGVVNAYPTRKLFQTKCGTDEGRIDWNGEIIRVDMFIPIIKPEPPKEQE